MGDELFNLRLSGENAASAETVGKALTAIDDLFKAVAEEMGIDPDDIRLNVGRMRWICDGCECERPDGATDWTKRDGLDFCAACSHPAAVEPPEEEG